MSNHVYRAPRKIECKALDAPGTCGYCHRAGAIQKSGQCKFCHTWHPSPLSTASVEHLRKLRRKSLLVPGEFRPRHDGVFDADPLSLDED